MSGRAKKPWLPPSRRSWRPSEKSTSLLTVRALQSLVELCEAYNTRSYALTYILPYIHFYYNYTFIYLLYIRTTYMHTYTIHSFIQINILHTYIYSIYINTYLYYNKKGCGAWIQNPSNFFFWKPFFFALLYVAEFDRTDPAEFQRLMQGNYLGSVYPTRCVVPHMKAKKDGRIVFVASQVAQVMYVCMYVCMYVYVSICVCRYKYGFSICLYLNIQTHANYGHNLYTTIHT